MEKTSLPNFAPLRPRDRADWTPSSIRMDLQPRKPNVTTFSDTVVGESVGEVRASFGRDPKRSCCIEGLGGGPGLCFLSGVVIGYSGALSTGRPMDGQSLQNLGIYMVFARFAHR